MCTRHVCCKSVAREATVGLKYNQIDLIPTYENTSKTAQAMLNHRSTSLKNLYLRIPSQHESTDVWQDPPEAYNRPRSCPAVLMKGTGDWTTAFGPASPTPRQNLAASQPASPNRFRRHSQVLQNHNKILFGAAFSLSC